MYDASGQKIAVIGSDTSATAACALLKSAGAAVWLVPVEGVSPPKKETATLRSLGISVISANELPENLDFAVHSSQVSPRLVRSMPGFRNLSIISDLELGSRSLRCLCIAVTGTNGKTTTAELVTAMLDGSQRKTIRAGASGAAICEVAQASRELDILTLDLNSFQLETVEHFRPSVAVITNIRRDQMDTYTNLTDFARVLGRVFLNQQVFDWAIVQTEALALLRSLDVPIPSKIITFSANNNRRADIFLDRSLLISSLPNWSGPLLDLDQCVLRGPHNAENVMAALAVGRVLRLPLEDMISAVKVYRPGPHRLEVVAEAAGIKFINNSKAMNVDAVQQSIEAIPPLPGGEPNIWLIAGGKEQAQHYHDLGPLLARRLKGAFLLGESRERLRAAWSLFTHCTVVESLLEAVSKAQEGAVAGDVILLSPACSSRDMFENYQERGDKFRAAVEQIINHADLKNRPMPPDACAIRR
jgi:UDP-N-acetylmuramoylalanine--D-glutamate ligase